MYVYACGINTNCQILDEDLSLVCCPTRINYVTDVTEAKVAFSHIFWNIKSGWKHTGFKQNSVPDGADIGTEWKVYVSENRTAVISSDGSVLIWENKWRTLHFQSSVEEHETDNQHLSETFSQNMNNQHNEKSTEVLREIPKISESSENEKITNTGISHENKNDKNRQERNTLGVHCSHEWEPERKRCHSKYRSKSFSKIALEDNTLLALCSDGVVFSGSVPIIIGVKVNEVAVGKEHCMMLTEGGEVYSWGSGISMQLGLKPAHWLRSRSPQKLMKPKPDIVSYEAEAVAQKSWLHKAEAGFSPMSDEESPLRRGQLGIGELCKSEKPVVIESLQGIMVSSIACGAWHCVAQGNCGDVYVWGWNESGQLGFPPRSHNNHTIFESFQHTCQCPGSKKSQTQSNPDGQNELRTCSSKEENRENSDSVSKAIDISVTQGNTNSDDLRVNSQRSREVVNVQASPKLLDFWTEDVNVVSVECGDRHTLFMIEDGSVWAAGMNRYGQLGLGHTRATEEPSLVLRGGVTRVFAGGWNSVFITTTVQP